MKNKQETYCYRCKKNVITETRLIYGEECPLCHTVLNREATIKGYIKEQINEGELNYDK